MKIAILSEFFYPYLLGGGERRYYEIAKRLSTMGHEVSVYTLHLAGTDRYEEHEGIKIHRSGWPLHPRDRRSLRPLPIYLLSLLARTIKADIVDCNTYFPCFAGRVQSIFGRPVIATIHDIYKGHWGEALGNMALDTIGNIMEKLVCEFRYDGIICPSNSTIDVLQKNFEVDASISLIPNGVDIKLIDSVEGDEKEDHRICYCGRLVPLKHVGDLINAVEILRNEYPDIKCTIVGDGFLREELETLVKRKALERVIEFTGFIYYHRLIRIMKSSSVFVNPSTMEGFSVAVLEAMRCKCAAVGYRLDAYKDFCDENNSILVEKRNVNQLVNAIRKCFSNNTHTYGKYGYETAGNYDWDKIADMTSVLYHQILAEG